MSDLRDRLLRPRLCDLLPSITKGRVKIRFCQTCGKSYRPRTPARWMRSEWRGVVSINRTAKERAWDDGNAFAWAKAAKQIASLELEIARLTAERDKAMVEANVADARVVAVARENCDLKRDLAKGSDRVYAPDGRTWQDFAYGEAGKRGVYKAELDRLRSVAADAYESWADGSLSGKQMHDLSLALGFT